MRILNFLKNKTVKIKDFFRNTAKNIREDFTPTATLTDAQRDARRVRTVLQPASGRRITTGFMLAAMMMSVMGVTAFAEGTGGGEGVETFNTVVGFIGAVQFTLGFKDDSADGKTRGLMCLASDFIVFAVAKAYDMFTV